MHDGKGLARREFLVVAGTVIGGVALSCTRADITQPEAGDDGRFLIPVNASDPLLLRAMSSDGQVIDYIGTRNAQGRPMNVEQVTVSKNEQSTRYLLLADGRPSRMYAPNGTQFDLTWTSATSAALTVRAADGKSQVNTVIDLAKPIPKDVLPSLYTASSAPDIGVAARSNRAARMDFVARTPAQATNALASPSAATTVTVTALQCGVPANNLDVYVEVKAKSGEFLGEFRAVPSGNGTFVASVPNDIGPVLKPAEICDAITNALGTLCLTTIAPGLNEYLCAALGAAIASTAIGAVIAVPLTAACLNVTIGLDLYCAVVDGSAVPGSPSLAAALCKAPILNRKFPSDVTLRAKVLALPSNVYGASVSASGSGPYPTVGVDLGGVTTIRTLKLNPPSPSKGQGYVGTADVFCLPTGTLVTMSITGTDGYSNSQVRSVSSTQQNGTYTLAVPGAGQSGIRDTMTVTIKPPTGATTTLTSSLVFS